MGGEEILNCKISIWMQSEAIGNIGKWTRGRARAKASNEESELGLQVGVHHDGGVLGAGVAVTALADDDDEGKAAVKRSDKREQNNERGDLISV